MDNLCDTCKQPMSIKRSAKNSRFLVCLNPECGRKKRAKTPVVTNVNVKPIDTPKDQKGVQIDSPRRSIFALR